MLKLQGTTPFTEGPNKILLSRQDHRIKLWLSWQNASLAAPCKAGTMAHASHPSTRVVEAGESEFKVIHEQEILSQKTKALSKHCPFQSKPQCQTLRARHLEAEV